MTVTPYQEPTQEQRCAEVFERVYVRHDSLAWNVDADTMVDFGDYINKAVPVVRIEREWAWRCKGRDAGRSYFDHGCHGKERIFYVFLNKEPR